MASAKVESSLLDGLTLDNLTLLLATRLARVAAVRLRVGPALDLVAGSVTKDTGFGESFGVGRGLSEGLGDGLSESIGRAAGLHASVGGEQAVTGLDGVVGISLRVGEGKSLSGSESSALETVARSTRHAARAGIELVDIGVSLSKGLGLTLGNRAVLTDEETSWVGLGDGLPLLATWLARVAAVWFGVGAATARLAWVAAVRVGLTGLVLSTGLARVAAVWVGYGVPLLAAWLSRITAVRIRVGDGSTVGGGREDGGCNDCGDLHVGRS